MAQLHIDFEWQRDAKGYRLVDAEPPKLRRPAAGGWVTQGALSRAAGITLPEHLLSRYESGEPQRIVRRGGDLRAYRPLVEYDGLFRYFATDATTPAGVLHFIERFGPLTRDGLSERRGENVRSIIAHGEAMRRFLDASSDLAHSDLAKLVGLDGIKLSQIDVALIVDPALRTLKLQLSVKNLLAALWLQLGQALSSGAIIRQCNHCGGLFEAGAGTGRRLDAKFCSDEHRVAFNSAKRTKEK